MTKVIRGDYAAIAAREAAHGAEIGVKVPVTFDPWPAVRNTAGRPIPNIMPRAKHDWYQEPAWTVESLLDAMGGYPPPASVWDPACGSGTIPTVLKKRKIRAVASDIRPDAQGETLDFLRAKHPLGRAAAILSNPPYKHLETWIRHAHKIMPPGAPIVFLARLSFLEGQARYRSLWQDYPPVRVWVHCRRVSIPPAGQDIPAKGGSVAYAWFEWRARYPGAAELKTEVRWIP